MDFGQGVDSEMLGLLSVICLVGFKCVFMDPAKILIWNVRGLNSTSRQDSVRSIVDSSRSDIVCIQETKVTDMSRRIIL